MQKINAMLVPIAKTFAEIITALNVQRNQKSRKTMEIVSTVLAAPFLA